MKKAACQFLLADMYAMSVVMGISGVFASIAICASRNNPAYLVVMREIAPLILWSLAFSAYALIKLTRAICSGSDFCKYLGSILGIVLWSTMLATGPVAAVFDPMKLLFGIPIFCEIWMFGQAWAGDRTKSKGTLKYEPSRY